MARQRKMRDEIYEFIEFNEPATVLIRYGKYAESMCEDEFKNITRIDIRENPTLYDFTFDGGTIFLVNKEDFVSMKVDTVRAHK